MPFLQNAWYMIAWSDEVGDSPFSRTVLDTPIVLYRDKVNDRVVGMVNVCPHRFAPLSMGKINGANLQCAYHGLEFGPTGECIRYPFANTAPGAAKVRAFPVEEKQGAVWIWLGDPSAADPSAITVIPHHANAELRCVHGYTKANADYRLISDNLMDLTHIAFLHPSSFGMQNFMPKLSTKEDSDGSVVGDFIIEEMPNFLDRDELPGEMVRVVDTIRWRAPALHLLDGYATSIEQPNRQWHNPSAHILTPETATSTHYFWSSALAKNSAMSDEAHLALLDQAFGSEDKPMVEAVQRNMRGRDLWDMNPVLLKNDAGAVRVRRRLTALIEAEAKHAAAPAATS